MYTRCILRNPLWMNGWWPSRLKKKHLKFYEGNEVILLLFTWSDLQHRQVTFATAALNNGRHVLRTFKVWGFPVNFIRWASSLSDTPSLTFGEDSEPIATLNLQRRCWKITEGDWLTRANCQFGLKQVDLIHFRSRSYRAYFRKQKMIESMNFVSGHELASDPCGERTVNASCTTPSGALEYFAPIRVELRSRCRERSVQGECRPMPPSPGTYPEMKR